MLSSWIVGRVDVKDDVEDVIWWALGMCAVSQDDLRKPKIGPLLDVMTR